MKWLVGFVLLASPLSAQRITPPPIYAGMAIDLVMRPFVLPEMRHPMARILTACTLATGWHLMQRGDRTGPILGTCLGASLMEAVTFLWRHR
jgi:hypothetical protein